jgi:hypothetical protein
MAGMSDLSMVKPPVIGHEGRLLSAGQWAATTTKASINPCYRYG